MSKKNKYRWTQRKPEQSSPAPATSQPSEAATTTPAAAPSEIGTITPAQLLANRANAQLSSGPRTETGKAISSRNALKSALTGRTVLLPADDRDEYAEFLAEWQRHLKPVGRAECELVQAIVDTHWRLRRIQALEFALYAHGHLQFESEFADQPEDVRYNLILLQTHITYEKQFRNFNLQETRLNRRREKDMAELCVLQAARHAQEETREPEATETTCFSENGFEFSNGFLMAGVNQEARSISSRDCEGAVSCSAP